MLERSSIVNRENKRIFKRRLRLTFRPKGKHCMDVTVCIAAICEGNTILGAADRMITSGDIEFEPAEAKHAPVFKIVPLMNSIVMLWAGDSGFQSEAALHAWSAIQQQLRDKPTAWPFVNDAVNHYIEFYNRKKSEAARKQILVPLGLDQQSFVSKQKEMSPEFIKQVTAQLQNFEMPEDNGVETIFTGIDDTGPHMYMLVENEAICCDPVGFAAIGSGGRHAESQFMLSGHSRNSALGDTLLLLHAAKKRSEVAPGVGKATDMFTIGPVKGTFAWLGGTGWPRTIDMNRLDAIYDATEAKQQEALNHSKQEMRGYIEEIRKAAAGAQAKQPTGKTDVRAETSSKLSFAGDLSAVLKKKQKTTRLKRKKS